MNADSIGQGVTSAAETAAPAAAMGHQVRAGMAWTMGLTIVGRGLSLAAQVVLAAIFSEGDWGVFAIFTSIFLVVTCLRHFSLNQLLLQRGPEAFERLVGPVYWLVSVLHWACAGLIAALAWPLSWLYQHEMLMWYMLIGAASLLPGAPAVVYIARLQQQLRFREATIITGASSFVRFGGQIGLALAGVGPLSFVLPMLATAMVEWVMGWWFVREALWKRAGCYLMRDICSSAAWRRPSSTTARRRSSAL
jgi:O-antigen/teichoic acid export membrane protein